MGDVSDFVICVGVVMWAEVQGNPHLLALGHADSSINMEGKESRFGVLVSSLFAVVTTAASCGAVIAMHDSFTALGGMVPMWLRCKWWSGVRRCRFCLYGMMLLSCWRCLLRADDWSYTGISG